MERIYTTIHNHKEVLVLNYSSLKEDDMVRLLDAAVELVMKDNKPVLVLNIFKDNYVTPKYMRYFEKELPRVNPLVIRNAVVGLSKVQHWILLAVNLWSKVQIHHFDTIDEALDFLTQE